MTHTIAILTSDWHLCHTPPSCRGERTTDEWYMVQQSMIKELGFLSGHSHARKPLPVIVAGDIFDRWNPPSSLLAFAIRSIRRLLGRVYAVPGQHDLAYHSLESIPQTGYGVLQEAEVLHHLDSAEQIGDLWLHPCPWGSKPEPVQGKHPRLSKVHTISNVIDEIDLLVAHYFLWSNRDNSYTGAPEESKISSCSKVLETYDAAVFGDNHKGFAVSNGNCSVLNNGTMFRRTRAEIDYQPQCGLLQNDGTIKIHKMEYCQADYFVDDHSIGSKDAVDASQFEEYAAAVRNNTAEKLDFRKDLARKSRELSEPVSTEVLSILEEADER